MVGFSAIGRRVAEQLVHSGEHVLIIERDPSTAEIASTLGYLVVEGDAGVDGGVLERAAIERATVLTITIGNADRRLTITPLARTLNPTIRGCG